MNIIKIILLLGIVSIATYTDIKENKIKNKHLFIALILGVIISTLNYGFQGLKDSMLGIVVPFVLLFIFFAFRMFGAGDIKLYSTIGSIMGLNFVINNIIYSFLIAGIVIILKLILSKDMINRIKRIYTYFKNMFLTQRITEFEASEEEKFPFAIAILIGTLIQLSIGYKFM